MREITNNIIKKIDYFVEIASKYDYLIIIVMKMLLDISIFLLYRSNNGDGIYELDFCYYKYVYSYFAIIFLIYLLKKYDNSIAKFYLYFFIIIAFLPISTLYAFCNKDSLLYSIFFVMFIVMIFLSLSKIKTMNFMSKLKNSYFDKCDFRKIIVGLFIVVSLAMILIVVYFNGIPGLGALNVYSVYEIRNAFYLPKYSHYLFSFAYKFIIPFLIAYYFCNKKYGWSAVFVFLQLFLFLSSGHKAILFIIPLLLVVLCTSKSKKFHNYFKVGVPLCTLFSIVVSPIIRTPFDLFIRRFLFVPANLKFAHFAFFNSNPKLGFIGTFFYRFFHSGNPYTVLDYPNAICGNLLGRYNETCGTGFLIEGYDRFGYIGFLIIAILFVIFLRMLNNFEKQYDFRFTLAISLMLLVLLNDGFLISGLFIHEYLLLILTLFFFRFDGGSNAKNK